MKLADDLALRMQDLRHEPHLGQRAVQAEAIVEILDLRDVPWLLREAERVIRLLQWGASSGPVVSPVPTCPACGVPEAVGHTERCPVARVLEGLR